MKETLEVNGNICGKGATPEIEAERIRKVTEQAKLKNGGYREGSGRGKKGWYQGIYCDSSWELAFVIYHKDHKIDIQRCKEVRTYEFENEIRNYYPDFVVDNQIYEIKGYITEQSKVKELCNPDIKVLKKEEMKTYLVYAISTYGKDYIKLYE